MANAIKDYLLPEPNEDEVVKLSIREKVAYGLGDTASNFIFATIMSFQALFYTDVFGLEPYIMGIMFIAVRVIDAVTDPIMGH